MIAILADERQARRPVRHHDAPEERSLPIINEEVTREDDDLAPGQLDHAGFAFLCEEPGIGEAPIGRHAVTPRLLVKLVGNKDRLFRFYDA